MKDKQFALQEEQKTQRWLNTLEKNKWLLENKTFAMFDIESTDLNASFGRLICACIRPWSINDVSPRSAKVIEASRSSDKGAVKAIIKELDKYDYIVTWYGMGFDIPFIQTRALIHELQPLGAHRHLDFYYTSRGNLKFKGNSLAMVSETLFGETLKTRIRPMIWGDAMIGKKEAWKYIIDHCELDVEELERVFVVTLPFRNLGATRIRGAYV